MFSAQEIEVHRIKRAHNALECRTALHTCGVLTWNTFHDDGDDETFEEHIETTWMSLKCIQFVLFFCIHLSLFEQKNRYDEKKKPIFERLGTKERVSDSIEKEMNMVQVKMLENVLDFHHKWKPKVIQR